MKVVLDALIYDQHPSGIGQYVRQLAEALAEGFPEDDWEALVRPGVTLPGFHAHEMGRADLTTWRRLLIEQVQAPPALRSLGYDVVHFTDYRRPLLPLARTVVTVHDLAAFRYPETFSAGQRRLKQWFLRQSVRRADRIIVPSASTEADLVNILGVDPERVAIVPHGVTPVLIPPGPSPRPRPYLLFVGTLEPRKNLVRLIEAYAKVRDRLSDVPDLVIIGRRGWLYQPILRAVEDHHLADRVIFLGYVPRSYLPSWYQHAVGFCFPTLYEGFGLPVLEAMAADCPVMTANRGAAREVAEGAALLVDPENVDAIAEGMSSLIVGADVGATLRAAGRERARLYPWARTAAATRAVYQIVSEGD